jgi:hypothetical protein
MKRNHLPGLAILLGVLSGSASPTLAQTYHPANWVNDPFCPNPNYGVLDANTTHPTFTNNATQRGTLYLNSPIGETLKLTNPGDTLTFTGRVNLQGDINRDGDMQFRVGLYYRGRNVADTNWLGYTFGNPAGSGGGAVTGLFVRKNPNPGVFASGYVENATRPECQLKTYSSGWAAGAYDFTLSVKLTGPNAQEIAWSLTGVAPSAYSYCASYQNTNTLAAPMAFDQVGFMGGAALFNSASTANRISFTNLAVTLGR